MVLLEKSGAVPWLEGDFHSGFRGISMAGCESKTTGYPKNNGFGKRKIDQNLWFPRVGTFLTHSQMF